MLVMFILVFLLLYVDAFTNVINILKIIYDFGKLLFTFSGIIIFGISFLGAILEIFKIIGLQYAFF